jgi:glycosyltransferase involved in cell wall biosynthesis
MNFLSYIDGNARLKFIFNTNGASKSRFEKQLKINFFRLLDSGTVCIGNTVSPSEYEELMNTSQIGIIFQDQNAGNIVFPSKFASMLVSGQAILAFINEDCLMAKIILDNDLGWVVDTVNPVLIYEVLNEIYNEEALFRKRTNAKKYGIENYSISSVAVKWIDLLKNL